MSALAVVDQETGELLERHGEQIAALNAALAKAQAKFPAIKRERNVSVKTKDGGSYSYSYASLDVILDAVRKPLADNGLALVQLLQGDGIRTELRHADGGVIGASFPLPHVPERPQELGSMLTYLRRYAIVAILGIAPEEDDDGAAAQRASEKGASKMSEPQRRKIHATLKDLKKLKVRPRPPHPDLVEDLKAYCREQYETELSNLSGTQASRVIDTLAKRYDERMEAGEGSDGGTLFPDPDEDIPFG